MVIFLSIKDSRQKVTVYVKQARAITDDVPSIHQYTHWHWHTVATQNDHKDGGLSHSFKAV